MMDGTTLDQLDYRSYSERDQLGYGIEPGYVLPPAGTPPLDAVSAALARVMRLPTSWDMLSVPASAEAPYFATNTLGDVPAVAGSVPTAMSPVVAQDAPMQFYSTAPETSILIQSVGPYGYDARLLTISAPALSYGSLPGIC